jgi:hypothetical protein
VHAVGADQVKRAHLAAVGEAGGDAGAVLVEAGQGVGPVYLVAELAEPLEQDGLGDGL